MWNPGVKVILRLCFLTFIYLTVTDCHLLPVTKSPARRAFEKKHGRVLPQDFMKNRSGFNNIKIPNSAFCSEMILRPEDHYLVLPWWFNYCQDLKERQGKKIQGHLNFDTVHKYVVAEVQLFKKRMKEKNFTVSELERELMAFNSA